MKGKIIGLNSGVYQVIDQDSAKQYFLKPKGVFRYLGITPKVGDDVVFTEETISSVETRKNTFVRPPVSNVDNVLLVTSLKRPDLSFELLDRFLINILHSEVKPIIIVTKWDLGTEEEKAVAVRTLSYYQKYYPVFYSEKDGIKDRESLFALIRGKISVVSGQTGVGKSYLLNLIDPSLYLKTQDISMALGRGKHTTREVSLKVADGMYIADTPGFSDLEFPDILPTDLKEYYPEFVTLLNKCRYHQCLHLREPGCAVKEAVNNGEILQSRYDSYLKIYDELKNRKPIYPKER